jgi:hypothetical protein
VTRAARKKHRRETLEGAAAELESAISNGSGWLFDFEVTGTAEEADVAEDYRVEVLNRLVAEIRRKVP